MEDPGSVQNENGQTELKQKRRISSILKAPRSPLTSILPINDRVKECPTKPVEKKQRKSRRVSFAETTGVKVFEKEATEITLLDNAAKEVEGQQQKMDTVQDVKRQISGMETLLHAPIQVPQQQFGENYNEQVNIERTTGDRTIVFSGDDNEDMDMTYSHTVLINENPPSKTGKVDFKDFLSRLNAAKKTDEQLKITTNQNVHHQTSDMEAFICDSNAVTQQKFEKNCNDQFNLQRTMGDKTVVFSTDNNEDMSLTRSHTVLIDENDDNKRKSRASTSVKLDFKTFISGVKTSEEDNLSGRRQDSTPYSSCEDHALSVKALAENKSQFTGFLSSINPNGQSASLNLNGPIDNLPVIQPNPHSLKAGKVDFKDFLSRLNAGKSTTAKENSFAASTEMFSFDLDKPGVNNANSSLLTNTDSLGVNFFPEKRNVLLAEPDVEITKSRTAAIDGNFMRRLTGQQEDFTGNQKNQPSMSLFPTDQELKRSNTVSKKSVNQALRESVPGSSFLFPKDQTIVFAGDDNMDMTRSHTVAIDSQSLQLNMTGQRVFGTGKEIRCESGKSLKTSSTVENHTEMSGLGLNLSRKSITAHYSQPDEQDDMEMTRSQTVVIDYKDVEAVSNPVTWTSQSVAAPVMSLPTDKTVVFSEELDDMDMTKCHTVAVDSRSLSQTSNGGNMTCKNMEAVNPPMEILRKPRESVCGLFSLPANNTVMFTEEQDDMDMTKSLTVAIDYKSIEAVNPLKEFTRKSRRSVAGLTLPVVKTVVFTEEHDDMDMTKSHTVAIDSKRFMQASEVFSESKSLSKSGLNSALVCDEQDDMEMTRSQTVAIDYKNIEAVNVPAASPSKRSTPGTVPIDKTVVFSEELDDMDITKSHTVAIDSRSLLQTSNGGKMDYKNTEAINPQMGVTRKPKKSGLFFLPADKTVLFAEEHDDMDMTKSHTVDIDSRGLSESSSKEKIDCKHLETVNPLFGTRKSRKSVAGICSLPADRTVMFAEENDDMDMTKSHTVAIDSKSILQASNKETTVLKSTLSLCKSDLSAVLLSGEQEEQEDTEITRSKTVAVDYKNNLNCNLVMGISRKSVGLVSHPLDKTVVFSGDENDMEITKSHTVAIDGSSIEASAKQNLIIPNKPGRASSLQINWISQNKNTEDEMEMTRSHTVCIDDHLPIETRGICSVVSSFDDRTVVFSSEQDDMDITRSNTVAIDNKDLQTTRNVRESVLVAPNEQNSVFSRGESRDENRGIGGSNENREHLNNKKICFDPEKQEAEVVDSKDKIDAANVGNQTAKHKRKSVSFRFPEHELDSEREVKIICTDPTTELNCLNAIASENTESFRCQTLNKELTETVHVSKASEDLNMGNDEEHTPYQPPVVEGDVNKSMQKTSSCEESIFTGEEPLLVATKARRSSLALIHSKLKSIRKIYEECPEKEMSSHTAPLQVIELKPENTDCKNEDALSNKSCRNENKRISDKTEFMEEAPEEPRDRPLETSFVLGDQTRNVTAPVNFSKETPQTKRLSLGVFLPKLPNKKRPHSSEGFLDDSNPTKLTGYHLFGKHLTKTAGLGALEDASKLESTFSLVQNRDEEIFPEFNDEMDSAESLNSEFPTSSYDETKPMEELQKKRSMEDSFFVCPEPVGTRGHKRPLPEDSSEDKMLIESTKKRRSQDGVSSNTEQVTKYTSQWDSNGEGITAENPPSMLAKTLDSTNSSSNTLNFTKCDSTFGDLSEQRYSQMESQFLDGDRYEHNLREKLLDGSITVKEFLQVLGVNILIQKPRQSQLPPKFASDAAPTPEDWLNEMHVYRPQLKVYEEDCQALCETIEKLKKRSCDQEKRLRSLNEPLWKMVKMYSEEQLRSLGSMLNEKKSDFRRKSKMLSHERKVGLYSKLLQSAQSEQKKLKDKITMADKLLSDLDECMNSLEAEVANMDLYEVEKDDNSISELELAVKAMEEECEHLKTQEANIEREQLHLYSEQKDMKSKLCKLQEEKSQLEMSIQELSSLAEWTLSEWLDDRAVFTFLNGSLELELIFGEPVDGVQKILDIKVYTLLDDEAAPSSSLVTHKLITQFFESNGSLFQKYTTQQDLQKLLLDISLVVCRCRLLGEELYYLQKNGPAKFEILEMVILNTDIKIIFSSFKAFAKFEITLSLTPVYPASRLHLSSFKNYIGNASCDLVEQIVSTVKPANSYLTRIVEKIHQDLLTKEHPWNNMC
ncbi:kinetochore scaffold 1-like [Polyodon spathula]|uniref:kinetochore scaffold 1-like n=1 Tax=Polyodon spathula TaxID=7913 RepID=UPI001B7E5F97|nr:kinetochore scaffold 1-like [Polyodon spathula]